MKKQVSDNLKKQINKFSGFQKAFSIFLVVILLGAIFLPLIKITYLDSTQIDSFTLLNTYMTKSMILLLLIFVHLFLFNLSAVYRNMLHKTFGLHLNIYISNMIGLCILLLAVLLVGDVVTLFKQTFSSRVGTTSNYIIMGILLVLGVLRNALLARIEHKKSTYNQEVVIKKEEDMSHYEPGFEQAKQNVEGLFGEDKK